MPMKSVLLSISVTNFCRSVADFREQLPLALLRLPLARDVADDLRCADDIAGVVPDGRDRQRDEDALAVASPPLGLEMLDATSGLEARDDLVFLGDAVLRNDERDVPAHRLLGGVAEEPLRGGVPALDDRRRATC